MVIVSDDSAKLLFNDAFETFLLLTIFCVCVLTLTCFCLFLFFLFVFCLFFICLFFVCFLVLYDVEVHISGDTRVLPWCTR